MGPLFFYTRLLGVQMMNAITPRWERYSPVSLGLEDIFHRLDALTDAPGGNYPPYNIVKTSDTTNVLEIALAGFSKDEITDVFLTHLHFDHCGGAVIREPKSGSLLPAFKKATYWVHRAQWGWATNPNSREHASFLKENILPLSESGCLKLIEGDGPILSKTPFPFKILLVNGHTEKQMLPIIDYKGRQIIYVADLIPTVGHLPIPYIMGYDTRPLLTLKEKELFLNDALMNNSLLFFEHDPHYELISLQEKEKGIRMREHYTFNSYFSS